MKPYKERHLYFFTCSKCGTVNRSSFKRAKAKKAICRKCRRHTMDKNQLTFIPFAGDIKDQL